MQEDAYEQRQGGDEKAGQPEPASETREPDPVTDKGAYTSDQRNDKMDRLMAFKDKLPESYEEFEKFWRKAAQDMDEYGIVGPDYDKIRDAWKEKAEAKYDEPSLNLCPDGTIDDMPF